jgi:hypothetical protein
MNDTWSSESVTASILACALLGLCGCATPRERSTYVVSPDPPTEEVRARLGTVAILADPVVKPTELKPRSKATAIGSGAVDGATDAFIVGAVGGLAGPYGVISGVMLAPVGCISGMVYGEFAGMTRAEFLSASNQLTSAVQALHLTESLAQTLADVAGERTSLTLLLSTNAPGDGKSGDSSLTLPAPQVAQTILEIKSTLVGFIGPNSMDPPLMLHWVVKVRLVTTSDGSELYADQFHCYGPAHGLRQWAANQGRLMRDELHRACSMMATQIVDQLFLLYPIPKEQRTT